MKPMSEEARALIEATRDLEAPPTGARSALRSALDAKIAAGATAAIGAGAAAKGTAIGAGATAKGTAIGTVGIGLTTKIVIGVAVTVSVGAVTIRQATRPATTVPAPARPALAPVVLARPTIEPPAPGATALEAQAPGATTPDLARETPRKTGPRVIATLPTPPRSSSHAPLAEAREVCGMAQEVKLLEQAQRDLQEHRPESVLAALGRASSACPETGLGEERLALRILALCQLGRIDEAHAETARLEREAPQSPSLGRIRAECP